MKGTGAKRNVCPGSCVSTGAKFPVESAPMPGTTATLEKISVNITLEIATLVWTAWLKI